jgi:hypothetical protein
VNQSGGLLQVPLLSLAKAGLPLVINFGSCTWPPFMANLARIKQVHARLADLVMQDLHHAQQLNKVKSKQDYARSADPSKQVMHHDQQLHKVRI